MLQLSKNLVFRTKRRKFFLFFYIIEIFTIFIIVKIFLNLSVPSFTINILKVLFFKILSSIFIFKILKLIKNIISYWKNIIKYSRCLLDGIKLIKKIKIANKLPVMF